MMSTLEPLLSVVQPRRGLRDHAATTPEPERRTAVGFGSWSWRTSRAGSSAACPWTARSRAAGLPVDTSGSRKADVANAEAGDCIHVETDTDFKVVDCATPEAQYKVLSVVDGVSSASCEIDPDYDSAIEITGDTTKSLCRQTWLQVGDCVQDDGSWAECGSAESAYEVAEVLAETQDDTACPDSTAFVRVYQAENNVICLAEHLQT